ncbi:unnamed protein product (macronuclear) [Paramecium tetraurelia]|uniref:Ribosomal RNA methyltransferase FtsJ domain-containing protein n=1 Tax=Paramecium tetraurelia TaxID=5888 RepID=A0BQZ3_PARTE|nr:uncharacterized protein GSPATT00031189001 [Paramecium tetraurelia]CAK60960.1 unnamed protein product [Paramecium tetraurelia]|eukprot:XP_001428358.1 hypothetical protein (macronuclear) [Paramecium tetraurelia strain d4-2]
MGKFTKDKRVQRNSSYSKQVFYNIPTTYIFITITALFTIFRIFIIGKQKKINLEPDLPISYYRQMIPSKYLDKQREQLIYVLHLLSEKNYLPSESCRIVSVDLQEMAPLDHVTQIQGDITKKTTVDEILKKFNYQRADIIVCDGAPDVTGFHDIDYYIQSQLIVAALNICLMTLRENGIFVAKIFKGSDIKLLYSQFKLFFNQVYFMKPKSSRASSVEYFIICLQYTPKIQTQNFHLYTFLKEIEEAEKQKQEEIIDKETENEQSKYYKFITCGDLSGFDEN